MNQGKATLQPEIIDQAARTLWKATIERQPIERLTASLGDFSLADAYAIQMRGMKLRQEKGSRWIGWKMGLTSLAKREQMSLHEAIFGYLFEEGWERIRPVDLTGLIHAKAEPEIGFRLKKRLIGKVGFEEACDAIGGVCAAIEIIDSRYQGFKYFSLPDVVADNCSAGRFVWGEEIRFDPKFDLAKAQMKFLVNGEAAATAPGGEISGHPVNSIVQLAALLAPFGLEIPEGCLVLAGAATTASALASEQHIVLEVDGLPTVSFTT